MKEFWYVVSGAFLGFIICFLFFRENGEENPGFKCEPKQFVVQYCIDSSAIDYSLEPNIDEKMNEYYREAYINGDSIGFSIDKNLINNLAAYVNLNEQSFGVRLYPGQNGINKYILVKPLDNQGNELPDLGTILDVTSINMGLGGPCPRWCAEPGRLITPP